MINKEECYPLSKAAKFLPAVRGQKPPHPMTLHRWATKGIFSRSRKRIHLETIFVGGTRVTSKEALERFFLRKDDVLEPQLPRPSKTTHSEKRAQTAKRVLEDMGMLTLKSPD